jgi:hypothetical protein
MSGKWRYFEDAPNVGEILHLVCNPKEYHMRSEGAALWGSCRWGPGTVNFASAKIGIRNEKYNGYMEYFDMEYSIAEVCVCVSLPNCTTTWY